MKPVSIQRSLGEELSISGLYIMILIVRQRRKFILFSITMDSGDIIEVWDGRTKGPPRKEKFPDKDSIVEKMKKLSS